MSDVHPANFTQTLVNYEIKENIRDAHIPHAVPVFYGPNMSGHGGNCEMWVPQYRF